MYRQFALEGEVHVVLDCVPLAVRRKLDLAELKISLAGWQTLSRAERLALCHLPVDTDDDVAVYAEVLRGFAARAGVPLTPLAEAPVRRAAWDADAVSARLRDRLGPDGALDALDGGALGRLAELNEEERYALFKLADPKRGPEKLRALLGELGLSRDAGGERPPG
ncbi:nitrate reductase associated protein [Sorangium sp. So ce388]|uniref:nitrate reductase associated protein n=1 Tax=Sorangium sp. So ce388 TaxID=3133309 RepID=UPI003F5B528C